MIKFDFISRIEGYNDVNYIYTGVGTKVFHYGYGNGRITSINKESDYPIIVEFNLKYETIILQLTYNGKLHIDDDTPVIFKRPQKFILDKIYNKIISTQNKIFVSNDGVTWHLRFFLYIDKNGLIYTTYKGRTLQYFLILNDGIKYEFWNFYKEFKKVKCEYNKNDLVYVSNQESFLTYHLVYFSHFDGSRYYVYEDGNSTCNNGKMIRFEFIKPVTKEDHKNIWK